MNAKDVLRLTLGASDMIMTKYIEDLSDAELTVVPIEGMNHIAWQVGHLIATERMMVEGLKPGTSPPLPAGFEAAHPRDEKDRPADPKAYKTKAEYLGLFKAQRAATLQALEAMSDAEMDSPAPERFQRMAPTAGAVYNLAGTHILMHVGQFVAVRRALKKPIAI